MDDLSEEQQQIADVIGLESYKKLVSVFAGISVYIPKLDSIAISARNRRIRKEFNGFNYSQLAQKYKISERHIRRIVDERDENQVTLF